MKIESKEELLTYAMEVFRERGYKKTNISDITKKAKIAVGSFYKFYSSKEDIFLAAYIKENNNIREKILSKVRNIEDPKEAINTLFSETSELFRDNEIIAEWYKGDISPKLKAYYKSEEGMKDYSFHHHLRSYIEEKALLVFKDEEILEEILLIYDFLYDLECRIPSEDIKSQRALKAMFKYIVKGVMGS